MWRRAFGRLRLRRLQAGRRRDSAATYESRSILAFVDFPEKVEGRVPDDADRVYAVADNLKAHKAHDVPCSALPTLDGSPSSVPGTPPTST